MANYPLNSVRTFEVAARLESYAKAAEELKVTPAAVSHQVKKLEEFLNVRLFNRLNNRLELTGAGARLLPDLSDAFRKLDAAIANAQAKASVDTLTLSIAPMFATKFLFPRLQSFHSEHPDIDVRLSSNLRIVDFVSEGIDAAIRIGTGNYPGLRSVKLFDEILTPMCSPAFAEKWEIAKIVDLLDLSLLHDDSMAYLPSPPTWETWFEAAGIQKIRRVGGLRFNQPDHALQAAIDGAGVVLGWKQHAKDDLNAGRLVQLFDIEIPLGASCFLVLPEEERQAPNLRILEDWIFHRIEEAADR